MILKICVGSPKCIGAAYQRHGLQSDKYRPDLYRVSKPFMLTLVDPTTLALHAIQKNDVIYIHAPTRTP